MNPDRFWGHVRKGPGCWIWRGALNDSGYGRVKVHGAIRSVHRVAYELAFGPIPENAWVRQRCGERACCRPGHLEVLEVTRLTPDDVDSIRGSFLPARRLAKIYHVSHTRIFQLRRCIGTG
jgi:hypothetical protein